MGRSVPIGERRFTFNTFSVHAYNEAVENGRFPTAIGMPVSPRLERMFWLYWRIYETRIAKAGYRDHRSKPHRKQK